MSSFLERMKTVSDVLLYLMPCCRRFPMILSSPVICGHPGICFIGTCLVVTASLDNTNQTAAAVLVVVVTLT